MSTFDGNITVTAYPGSPQHTAASIGWAQVQHRGGVLDPDLFVSFDGVTDDVRLPPGDEWNSPSPNNPTTIWLRISAAGTVRATVSRQRWDGFR